MPPLIHFAMRAPLIREQRRRVVPHARGRVIEIGIGSGLNLPLYGPAVEGVVGIDPSGALLSRARDGARDRPFAVELIQGSAEALPAADASFDCAVSTWSLCSIPDPQRALAELRRVLRPDAAFLFIEHGRAPEPGVARWQDRINPLWRCCAGGCNMNRPIGDMVRAAGFRMHRLESGYIDGGPRVLTFHYVGDARS
ncbi:MAG: class I SAM-dependent methyltransferase [Rhodospirillales bacterium]